MSRLEMPEMYHCKYVYVGNVKVSKDAVTYTAGLFPGWIMVGQNRIEVINPSHCLSRESKVNHTSKGTDSPLMAVLRQVLQRKTHST